ncbi:MAG: M48 family metallopeptidase [Clostridia bacterium]|nr:M48 family metallopeptidase [Clostridia bacterium]
MQKQEIKCKQCGTDLEVNPGYITWCEHCDWNIDPTSEVPRKKAIFHRFNMFLGKKFSKNLYNEINQSDRFRPRLNLSWVFAFIFSIIIYTINLTVVLFFIRIGFNIFNAYRDLAGFVGLLIFFAIAYLFIPKFKKDNVNPIKREEFPHIYILVDRLTDMMGAPKIDDIVLTNEFNASFSQIGLNRKRILFLGLPLFYLCNNKERIALLAHEIAHNMNGDIKRGVIVGGALKLIENWIFIVAPAKIRSVYVVDIYLEPVVILINCIRWLISRVILSFWYVLALLLWRNSQRAEYYADYLESRISGTDASVSLLQKIQYITTYYSVIERISSFAYSRELFSELEHALKALPEREKQRIERMNMKYESSVDATHPPTRLRIEFLKNHHKEVESSIDNELVIRASSELEVLKGDVENYLIGLFKH